ncbi:MAG: PhoH family protein [Nanoarchaeota archaeon]|nr:PhoH family protein [Nanoarchaeota archaeon]
MKRTYVIDTNVIFSNANSIFDFGNSNIVIAFQVLEEIDKHKSRLDNIGYNARYFSKTLDNLRKKGNLFNGVKLLKGKSLIYVRDVDSSFSVNFSLAIPDNKILAVAMMEKFNNPDREIVVVSCDINMRIKCDSVGIKSQGYSSIKTLSKREHLYSGFTSHLVDNQVIDQFYAGEEISLEEKEITLQPNQFVMLISNSNEKKTCLAKFINYFTPLKKVGDFKKGLYGVSPKNKEQACAFNLLMDPSVQIVTLTGQAGSGKTLLSLAAALEQILGKGSQYQRLVISRPIIPVGKEIGFLPGSKEEKMLPWVAPISDNLQYLLGNDRTMLEQYVDKGIIEIEALTYIRGRSISNAFIIFDECQSLTSHEIKTILTRVGENTKIVLLGDITQIDNMFVNEFSNGLTYAIEQLKGQSIFGHITLQKGERSQVATISSKLL